MVNKYMEEQDRSTVVCRFAKLITDLETERNYNINDFDNLNADEDTYTISTDYDLQPKTPSEINPAPSLDISISEIKNNDRRLSPQKKIKEINDKMEKISIAPAGRSTTQAMAIRGCA